MRPIYEMTTAEFDALPDDERFKYPNLGGPGPSHSNYWICAIIQHVQAGHKIPKRVWENTAQQYKSFLRWMTEDYKDTFVLN